MAHSSELRWAGASAMVSQAALNTLQTLNSSEEIYQELLEVFNFVGGTDQLLADQFFFEIWSGRESDPDGNPGVLDTQANAAEVSLVADLKTAIVALHELYLSLTNGVVVQADRATDLRRMS